MILHFVDESEETLFINAWNPFSFIGNGNKNDNSVDGYFGRISAMSILGWTITNPAIQYESIDNVNIYYSKELDYTKPQFIQNPFQLIWNHNRFVKPTLQLITQGKKHHKLFKLIQQQQNDINNENKELQDFLQEPYDISHLKLPTKWEDKKIEWSTEIRTSREKFSKDFMLIVALDPHWKVYNMQLNQFYPMNGYTSLNKKFQDAKDYPFRNDNGKLISIPFLWHPLIYTDIQGIIKLNTKDNKFISTSIDPKIATTTFMGGSLLFM